MKVIKVDSCDNCPKFGSCKAWFDLTVSQRIHFGVEWDTTRNIILPKCPLEDYKALNKDDSNE